MRMTLLLWLLIPLVVLVFLSTFLANHFAEGFANKSFDSFLLNSADSIAARVRKGQGGVTISALLPTSQNLFEHEGKDRFFYQVVDKSGHVLAGGGFLPSQSAPECRHSNFANTLVAGHHVRYCSVPIELDNDSFWIQVGETLNSRNTLRNEILLSILFPQILLAALAGSVVWLGIGRGLGPLQRLGDVLKSRTEPDLSPVDIGETPAELIPVTEALNRLFVIVDGHCRTQQEFIADAAHQLRTPVTALKTYTDHLAFSNSFDQSVIGQLNKASNRLADLVNRLLVLARAEAKRSKELPICDLTLAVGDAAAIVVHQAIERKIELHFDIPDYPVNVRIDREDLIEVIVNLLDNAIKYGPSDSSVWVTVETDSVNSSLIIEDNGPGIPDIHMENVFKRFFRLAGNNESGCGLGLSIVREICAVANANVNLSERTGGGASFRITFPKCLDLQGASAIFSQSNQKQAAGADTTARSRTVHLDPL